MPYAKMGSAKKIAKLRYFLPILDAVAKILLIVNSKHPTQKLEFRETLGFVQCVTDFRQAGGETTTGNWRAPRKHSFCPAKAQKSVWGPRAASLSLLLPTPCVFVALLCFVPGPCLSPFSTPGAEAAPVSRGTAVPLSRSTNNGQPENCSAGGGGGGVTWTPPKEGGGGWRNGVPCRALCFV